MECLHQGMFTTFARVQVSTGGFKPAGSKRTSTAYPLPWNTDNGFHFWMSRPTMWNGNYSIQLFFDEPSSDLQVAMWTENEKGVVLAGNPDEYSSTLSSKITANSSTAFVCAKVRTISCQMCAMAEEVRSVCNEEQSSKAPATLQWAPEPPAARPWAPVPPRSPVKCDPIVQAFNDDWAPSVAAPPTESPAQLEDLWNDDEDEEDQWQDTTEGALDQWDEDAEPEDDYVPQWARAASNYHPYPTPPGSTTGGWADYERQQPPARYHPMNEEW